ncbi:MAG: phosphoribosylamine--glycine ligase [Deltaproteobacteria bacterium]|nr:phosphoribosylamine--glycine ligase [Deltaproteobacteria bacterium]
MPTVLVVGGGGREHALVDALVRAPSAPKVIAAPGNPGIGRVAECVSVPVTDVDALVALAMERAVDLVVVGPEAPLVAGLADRLVETKVPVFGPTRAAAVLEGSKAFAKAIMAEAGVPTARWGTFAEAEAAVAFARSLGGAPVVKADGLAAGKGVIVPKDFAGTEAAIRGLLGGELGAAGAQIVVEEQLEGEEISVMALCDGERLVMLAPSQDHKRLLEGDLGPNTGGMGAYSPPPVATPQLLEDVRRQCLEPVVARMKARGTPFRGVLYAGLMLTASGPKTLEFNVRFGDPEAQVLLPRLACDAFALFAAVAAGRLDSIDPPTFLPQAALSVVLAARGYPASPVTGDLITGVEAAEQVSGVTVFHAGTRRTDAGLVTAGGRVLSVTGLGADLEEAAQRAYEAARQIRFEGVQLRTDIGHRGIGRAVG